MNLEDLYIPAPLSRLMNDALTAKKVESVKMNGVGILVSESLLVDLFLAAGAISGLEDVKMNKNESNVMGGGSLRHNTPENQGLSTVDDKVIVEGRPDSQQNLVRAVMEARNLNLKTVAERYGGKSGAANIANFMAKSNEELAAMRPSTRRKLASALGCPEDWLMPKTKEENDSAADGNPQD